MPPKDCAPGSTKYYEANKRYCSRHGFKIGSKVRRGKSIRRIEDIYADIWGGVRLDSPVQGFVSWNISDLKTANP